MTTNRYENSRILKKEYPKIQKIATMQSLSFMTGIIAFGLLFSGCLEEKKEDPIESYLILRTLEESLKPPVNPIEEEAKNAGLAIPKAPLIGVDKFDITDINPGSTFSIREEQEARRAKILGGDPLVTDEELKKAVEIPNHSFQINAARNVVTTSGGWVRYVFKVNPTALEMQNRQKDVIVRIWVNGGELDVTPENFDGEHIRGLVLSDGNNYAMLVVLARPEAGGAPEYIGRSNIVKITSDVASSLLRVQLLWDRNADLDLHVDSDKAGENHVRFSDRNIDVTDRKVSLDIDDTKNFGPENIRVFRASQGARFRFFVNYYGSQVGNTRVDKEVNAWFYVYYGRRLVRQGIFNLKQADIWAESSFSATRSKLIGCFQIGESQSILDTTCKNE
jgi:uncharacterized protein YfaP (DUF2135 family)